MRETSGASSPPVRVLVIDDDRVVRELLRLHLDVQDGFTCVDEAEDAAQGLALAELIQPDVIILDAMMPGRSGIDAVPDLLAAAPSSGIVVYSAVVESEAIGRLRRLGVSAIVPKTDGVDALQEALGAVAAQRRPRPGTR
jgi:DNA-binding NarL/FixJ family response regulator